MGRTELEKKSDVIKTMKGKEKVNIEGAVELSDDEINQVAGGRLIKYGDTCPICGNLVTFYEGLPLGGTGHKSNCQYYISNCLMPGTMIKLADGGDKKVEDVESGDLVLTWNFETGAYDAKPVMFNDSEGLSDVRVIHTIFSDGTVVDVVGEHGFFDVSLAKYIYITDFQNEEYIGHSFVKYEEDGKWSTVTLDQITFEVIRSKVYSPVSFGDLAIYANGMLSLPGACTGLVNIFDVNTDTMTFDREKMAKDIAQYGLLKLNDFNGMISEEVFDGFGGKYLGVSMGKGLIDMNRMKGLIFRYAPYLETLRNEKDEMMRA